MNVASHAKHPDPEQLRRLALGLLRSEEHVLIERHLAGCDACCQAALTVADDRLATLLWREGPAAAAPAPNARRLACLTLALSFALAAGVGGCSPSTEIIKPPPGAQKANARLHSDRAKSRA